MATSTKNRATKISNAPIRPGEFDDSDIDPVMALRLLQAMVLQSFKDATLSEVIPKVKPLKRRAATGRREAETEESLAKRNAEKAAKMYVTANAPRAEARHWLLKDKKSFPLLVELAGYNPDDIREKAQRLQRNGWTVPSNVKLREAA